MDPSLEDIIKVVFEKRHVFLHGPGGVGKSYKLRHIANILIRKGIDVYVTATTGVAALGLSDSSLKIVATTLHRFAGIGTAMLSTKNLIQKVKNNYPAKTRWERCQVLIIDEISMLGSDLFQKLCAIAQAIRQNESSPMGGIQLIISGDFLQLPPVKEDWIFKTQEWEDLNIRPFILEVPYRYDNDGFFKMLLRIRKGKLTKEDYKTLFRRVRANQKIQKILEDLKDANPADVIKPTMFFSRRADVDAFNERELDKLQGELVEFVARDSIEKISGNPKIEDYKSLLDNDMPRTVSFKVGAQVMLRVNISTEDGLVNGSRGVVCEIIPEEALIVKFLSGKKVRIDIHTRKLEDKYANVTRTQIPFILAYAMTIHKSQGSTLDYCVVDLGGSVFSEGQAYVAISRCVDIKGLFISEFLESSIITNEVALKYSYQLENMALEEDNGINI